MGSYILDWILGFHGTYRASYPWYGTAQRQRRKRTQLFCDLRACIECNECVLSMRTSLDFRILYAKTNIVKESSATGCKYIDRFIRRRVFFVNLA